MLPVITQMAHTYASVRKDFTAMERPAKKVYNQVLFLTILSD